jgi:hypothetical protein
MKLFILSCVWICCVYGDTIKVVVVLLVLLVTLCSSRRYDTAVHLTTNLHTSICLCTCCCLSRKEFPVFAMRFSMLLSCEFNHTREFH